ncbi:MAG: hypothetical protein PHX40_01885 [Bacilli bacterium]|nr:hypothetical protein [Bacilli bacterium]
MDKFINESEYNIAQKEENSGNSILSYMTQIINNNFGVSYSIYNKNQTYTTQEMYKQDFNSIRVQNSLLSHLKKHFIDKNYFNLKNKDTRKEFDNLFPEDLGGIKNMLSAVESGNIDYRKLIQYIKNKTGIPVTKNGLIYIIKDISLNNLDSKPVTGYEFKNMLEILINSIYEDINEEKFIQSITNTNDKDIKLDTSVGEYLKNSISKPFFIALKNSFNEKFTVRPVMNVDTWEGNSLPTFKIGNLTYKDTELFDLRREFEKENDNTLFKSLLIQDNPAILGTLTKLEVIGKGRSKSFDKLTPEEQFISDFHFDFLNSALTKNSISVILGNYSDKSTIVAKIINGNFRLLNDEESPTIFKDSINNILEAVRKQGYTYYYDVIESILNDYIKIFNAIGLEHTINNDLNDLDNNITKINNILSKNKITNLTKKLSELPFEERPNAKLVEELHYSSYSDGVRLNNLVIDNFKIFSDSNENGLFYKEFVGRIENRFLNKFNKLNLSLIIPTDNINEYLNTFNFNIEQFRDNGSINYNSILINNQLNPFIKK